MKLIATQTLTSTQPSITFSSIPQNFTDLYITTSVRSDRSDGALSAGFGLTFNGSATGVSGRFLYGDGSSRSGGTSGTFLGLATSASSTSNTFGNGAVYIPNYNSSSNKSFSVDSVSENNGTTADQALHAGLWANTAAITSIGFYFSPGGSAINFVAGSTISLYGIGGAGDPSGLKATGGIISRSGDYWVHTFTSSGTFTPTRDLTNVEYLVVAGGGGGGGSDAIAHGAGGAGGYRSSVTGESSGGGASAEAKLSLASGTAYTVTVGAGGVSQTIGNNSVFGSITSIGGGRGGTTSAANGGTGGSGGGSGYAGSTIGNGTTGQGYNGGLGSSPAGGVAGGGGGGGAGQVGGNTSASNCGNGGNGISSSITGSAVTRGGGGGGGAYNLTVGNGGSGGGGAGGNHVGVSPVNGTSNTGGGGGAAGGNGSGATGGSGIVVVRYLA